MLQGYVGFLRMINHHLSPPFGSENFCGTFFPKHRDESQIQDNGPPKTPRFWVSSCHLFDADYNIAP